MKEATKTKMKRRGFIGGAVAAIAGVAGSLIMPRTSSCALPQKQHLPPYELALCITGLWSSRPFRNRFDLGRNFPRPDKALDYLDSLCSHLPVNAVELMVLVGDYPLKKDWAKGDLRVMLAECIRVRQPKRKH